MAESASHDFHYQLFSKDDLSGFWALFADNLANMVLVAILCTTVVQIPPAIVFGRILPGLGVALLAGLSFYSWMAHRLAARQHRSDVTALPYGISTPVLFVYMFAIILPVKMATGKPLVAWQVGVAAAFIGGIIEASGSLLGPILKRITPRAGMLGTLAGIAIVWIAAAPMAELLEQPQIGLPALAIILVGLVGRKRLPWGVPAGLAAIVVGTVIALGTGDATVTTKGMGFYPPIPVLGDLWAGLTYVFSHPKILLIVAPMEIYNFIETMNNVESAEAAGDAYNVSVCQAADGAGTLIGSCFGSPFPTTVYIGHPAYKRLGARSGYALGVGIVFFVGALFGMLALPHKLVPVAAVAPLLIFVAMAIMTQAHTAIPKRHVPAVALAIVPHIGDLLYKKLSGGLDATATYLAHSGSAATLPTALKARLASLHLHPESVSALKATLVDQAGIHVTGLAILSRGAIITGLLWGAITAFAIDGKNLQAAAFSLTAAALAFFGLIHTAGLGLHWHPIVLAYGLMALVFLAVHYAPSGQTQPQEGNDAPLEDSAAHNESNRLSQRRTKS